MKNKAVIFYILITVWTLLIFSSNTANASTNVSIQQDIKSTSTNYVSSSNSQTDIRIETNGQVKTYSSDKIGITGETLVKSAEDNDAICETVEGNHAEQVAFVNLKPNTTLDTAALNQQGDQAFNLDAWALQKQAKTLGVPDEFSIPASLTLYSATEIVLVEDKGKPALAVEIRN